MLLVNLNVDLNKWKSMSKNYQQKCAYYRTDCNHFFTLTSTQNYQINFPQKSGNILNQ